MTRKEDLERILEQFERSAESEFGMAKSEALNYVRTQEDQDRNASILHDRLGHAWREAATAIRGNIGSDFDGEMRK